MSFGDRFDPTSYQQNERLPQGAASSGVSWRMCSKEGHADCVFKMITVPMRDSQEIEKNLNAIRTAWQTAGEHPNIVKFLGCSYEVPAQRFILVTEYMDGLSLREYMHDGVPMAENILGGIVAQAVAALAHLHKNSHMCHRDIKPSNILLSSSGLVKITDLGQSRQLAATLDVMGSYVGAQVYMSPERIQGASYTSRCDVWSLGLVALQCALGRYPFIDPAATAAGGAAPGRVAPGASMEDVITAIEEGPPPALTSPIYSESAKDFCRITLEMEQERRAQSSDLVNHPWVAAHAAAAAAAVAAFVSAGRAAAAAAGR